MWTDTTVMYPGLRPCALGASFWLRAQVAEEVAPVRAQLYGLGRNFRSRLRPDIKYIFICFAFKYGIKTLELNQNRTWNPKGKQLSANE